MNKIDLLKNALKIEISEQKTVLLNDIRSLKQSLNELEESINNDIYYGLGGQMQNTWDLYRKLGIAFQNSRFLEKLECLDI